MLGNEMFKALRREMWDRGITQEYLGKKLGLCEATISKRLSGKLLWSLEEAYTICDILQIPHQELPTYFPPLADQRGKKGKG